MRYFLSNLCIVVLLSLKLSAGCRDVDADVQRETHCHLPEEIQGYHVNGKLLGDRQRDNIAKVTNILLRYYITTIIKNLKIKRPSKHGSSSRLTTGEAKTLLPDNGCMYTKHGKSVYIFANQSLGMFVFISRR